MHRSTSRYPPDSSDRPNLNLLLSLVYVLASNEKSAIINHIYN